MQKRIHGLMYDTETATLIAKTDNGYPVSDLKFARYELYKKRTGEYFLYGEGNAASECHHFNRSENAYEAGEIIRPLGIDDVKHWLEKYQDDFDHDIYEQEFGHIKQTGEKKQISLSLTVTAIEKLKRMASFQGKTQSEIVEELINAE